VRHCLYPQQVEVVTAEGVTIRLRPLLSPLRTHWWL